MKRTILILIFLILFLNGCASSGIMNLSAFIESYNVVSGKEVDFTVFTGHRNDDSTEYSFCIEEGKDKVLVTLKEKNEVIIECRITSVKIDENLSFKEINEKNRILFLKVVKDVSFAYTETKDSELGIIIDNVTKDLEAEEKTDKYRNYNMIFISNDLCTEFIIRDNEFYDEETTVKPENINSFLNTAPVRTETVPHR